MSEISGDLIASGENNKLEPDFFGFYTSEVADLLSQDESLWPFSHQTSHLPRDLHEVGREKGKTKNSSRTIENNGHSGSVPMFSNGIGALLSEFKSERLKSLLHQSVFSLTQEVDEMVNPVLSLCRIISCFRYKESLPSLDALACKADQNQLLHKKRRLFLSSSGSESAHVAVPVKKQSDDTVKKCTLCHKTETPQWRPAPDGTKSLCNACGLKANKNGSILSSNVDTGEENIEIDDDMRTILETDSTMVEELMKKHSSEFLAKLEHMEQKLEELLNNVMTSCRPMTATEKQRLRKLIQNLPPKNLDRVVDIIEHNKPPDKYSSDEMHVDLADQDKVTLWRLYYYVAANHKRSMNYDKLSNF